MELQDINLKDLIEKETGGEKLIMRDRLSILSQ